MTAKSRGRRLVLLALIVVVGLAVVGFVVTMAVATPRIGGEELAAVRLELERELAAWDARAAVPGPTSAVQRILMNNGDWKFRADVSRILELAPGEEIPADLSRSAERATIIAEEFLALVTPPDPGTAKLDPWWNLHLLTQTLIAYVRLVEREEGAERALEVCASATRISQFIRRTDHWRVGPILAATRNISAELRRLARHPDVGAKPLEEILGSLPLHAPSIDDFDMAARRTVHRLLTRNETALATGRLKDEHAIPFLGPRLLRKEGSLAVRELREYLAFDRSSWPRLVEEVEGWEIPAVRLIFGGAGFPAMFHFIGGGLNASADVRGTRLLLAIEAHRRRTGAYPESLDGLGELPVDPANGRAFVYRREGDRYVLYGVGRDGRDDGGDPSLDILLTEFDGGTP